jgi:hypothetical protein
MKITEVKQLHWGHVHVTLEDGSMDTLTREEVIARGTPKVGDDFVKPVDPRATPAVHSAKQP